MKDQFYTVKELAQRWKISEKRIYQLKEDIGYIQIGGLIRFTRDAIEEYERTHTSKSPRQKE